METQNINNLIQTVEDLRNVLDSQNLKVSDEVLFRESCTFVRGELAGKNFPKSSHGEPVGKEVGRFSPSPKQLKLLYDAGLKKEQIDKMSKLEVSKVIGEYLKNLKKENI
jgi:hypothetical protein